MGRYIGPKSKIARKFGEAIFGTDKSLEKKNYPPGQHGLARKRKKVSEYGTQLLEKQKAKAIYGVQEKQFYRTYEAAAVWEASRASNLLKLLRVPSGQRGIPFGHRSDARRGPAARFASPHRRERTGREHSVLPAQGRRYGRRAPRSRRRSR